MIITISGTPGAGDTTAAEMLAQEINHEVVEIGEIQKEIAKQKGLNSEQLWEEQEKNPSKLKEFHEKLDEKQRELVEENNDLIINGKLSAFQVKKADLKIFLDAEISERAKRVLMREKIGRKEFADTVDLERNYEEPSQEEINQKVKEIKKRQNKETKHWKEMYGYNYIEDKEAYDMLIDTTNKKPSEVVQIIKKYIKTLQDDQS